MKALPWPVRIYLALIVLSAGGLTIWRLVSQSFLSSDQLPLAGLLVGCMMLAWLFPLPVGFKTHFYLDTVAVIAAVLLFQPGVAMLIAGAGTLGAQIFRRRYPDEALFNTAQTMLQAAIAAFVLGISGFQGGQVQASNPGFVVTVLIVGIVLFLSSAALVGTVVALQGGLNPVGVWLESILKADDAVYVGQIVQVGLGLVIAVLGGAHPWTIILLIPSVAVVYVALDQGLELRRQVSLALSLQERNLTEAQRLAQVGSWEWDLSSGAHGWSEEAFHILGFDTPFPTPSLEHLLKRVHPDDRDALDGRIHGAVRYQSHFDVEHRVLRPDGGVRTVHHRGEVMRDDAGKLRLIGMIHDVSEQKSLEAQLEYMAYHDPLTGLVNRSRLVEEIELTLEGWRRGGKPFALLFIDLDGFKEVNDRLGHRAGDVILTDVARSLESAVRDADVVARYGGDEFIILARSVTRQAGAERFSKRLLESLEAVGATAAGDRLPVTASIGVVMPESRLDSSDELLQRVDRAMYTAKRDGKNQYAIFDSKKTRDQIFQVL